MWFGVFEWNSYELGVKFTWVHAFGSSITFLGKEKDLRSWGSASNYV